MKNFFLLTFLLFFSTEVFASIKLKIIDNLSQINNLEFKFEQNINGNIENGKCTIQYPKKIYCKYNSKNKKILVSNGKSLVIKTLNSYYIYPISKTPLNFVLNKNFILDKIKDSKEQIIDDKFIDFSFVENERRINIFFDKNTYDLIGWQTLDAYQNLVITYLYSIVKNTNIEERIFRIPEPN